MMWISVKDRLPKKDMQCAVVRNCGHVSNPKHKGYPFAKWVENTTYSKNTNIFLCDLVDTGNVTHWVEQEYLPNPT